MYVVADRYKYQWQQRWWAGAEWQQRAWTWNIWRQNVGQQERQIWVYQAASCWSG